MTPPIDIFEVAMRRFEIAEQRMFPLLDLMVVLRWIEENRDAIMADQAASGASNAVSVR